MSIEKNRLLMEAQIKRLRGELNEGWFEKIKDYFFGLKPGNLIVRPNATADGGSELYILVEPITEDNEVKVMDIGGISKNQENKLYAYLIFNTNTTGLVKINKNTDNYLSYRKLDNKEKKLVKDAIASGKFQRYIDIITKKTKLRIKI